MVNRIARPAGLLGLALLLGCTSDDANTRRTTSGGVLGVAETEDIPIADSLISVAGSDSLITRRTRRQLPSRYQETLFMPGGNLFYEKLYSGGFRSDDTRMLDTVFNSQYFLDNGLEFSSPVTTAVNGNGFVKYTTVATDQLNCVVYQQFVGRDERLMGATGTREYFRGSRCLNATDTRAKSLTDDTLDLLARLQFDGGQLNREMAAAHSPQPMTTAGLPATQPVPAAIVAPAPEPAEPSPEPPMPAVVSAPEPAPVAPPPAPAAPVMMAAPMMAPTPVAPVPVMVSAPLPPAAPRVATGPVGPWSALPLPVLRQPAVAAAPRATVAAPQPAPVMVAAAPQPSTAGDIPVAFTWDGVASPMIGRMAGGHDTEGAIAMNWPDAQAKCTGRWTAVPRDAQGRSTGVWAITCDNGRIGVGTFRSTSPGAGAGEGRDAGGKPIRLVFG